MNILGTVAKLASEAVALIQAVSRSPRTNRELAQDLQVYEHTISMWRSIGKAIPKDDLALADEYGFSMDKLREIAGVAKRCKNPNVDVEQLRTSLIHECAALDCDSTRRHVRQTLARVNEQYQAPRMSYLRFSAAPDSDGMKYIIGKMPQQVADRLQATLLPQAQEYVRAQRTNRLSEGLLQALVQRCVSGGDVAAYEHYEPGENPENPLDVRHRPCFLIPVDDPELVRTGKVVNTDGVCMDLQDLVDARVREFGFAVVCGADADQVKRPLRVFEVKRLADASDRFLTIISHLVCQHADCMVPAVRCQIHHIQAFTQGGQTVLENLCPLCRKHNLENDDDPAKRLHGRIVKDPVTNLVWYEDYKGRRRQNPHPAQYYNGIAASRRMLE